MKSFFLTISIVWVYAHSYAQNDQWAVKGGEGIEKALGDSITYKYPQFMPAAVYFRDGKISHALLNLNFVNGEMQFIALSKDTLAIANPLTIKYITIQSDTFYFDRFYIELIHSNTSAKLGKREIIKVSDIRKEGAYGQMSSTSAINTINAYYSNNHLYKLTEKSAVMLQKETVFYIGDSFNNFLPAAKKNIHKMFNTKMSRIEAFMEENKIMLNKEDDLVKLIDFLGM